jgi:hypothetical protein
LAIGGTAPAGDPKGTLLRRISNYYSYWYSYYSGEEDHDLVVPLASATAANEGRKPQNMNCDHFHYFLCGNPASEAVTEAISLIWDRTGLVEQVRKPKRSPELSDLIEELRRHSEQLAAGEREEQFLQELNRTLESLRDWVEATTPENPGKEEVVQILSGIPRRVPRRAIRELAEVILESLGSGPRLSPN